MWPTIDGLRILKGAEAAVVRDAVTVMVDQLADQNPDESQPDPVGIDWFDQWDGYQQLWLLEQVVESLFTPAPPLSPAAIWEATVDAIFCQAGRADRNGNRCNHQTVSHGDMPRSMHSNASMGGSQRLQPAKPTSVSGESWLRKSRT